jgi:hypothetical protein
LLQLYNPATKDANLAAPIEQRIGLTEGATEPVSDAAGRNGNRLDATRTLHLVQFAHHLRTLRESLLHHHAFANEARP